MVDADDHPAIPKVVSATSMPDFDYSELNRGDRIGTGGEANVYEATLAAEGITYKLAVKEPRVDGTVQTEIFEQFEEEAETWATLDEHQNIVSVYGFGTESVPWIALEYMDGGTLGDRSDDIDFEEGLWLAGRIAEGIRHGHRHGIAHLDLKPSNILLRDTPDDKWPYPKVGDWGLAKLLLEHSKSIEALSPRYAAPEQFDAEEYGRPDDLTDVYQFGTIVYELLTGQPPFTGSATDVMQSTIKKEPDVPSKINSRLPDDVDDILLKSLRKRKDDRFESILIFRRELDQLFYEYATDNEINVDVSRSTATGSLSGGIETDDEEPGSINRGSNKNKKESSIVSRRNALAALGVVGTGGVAATQMEQISGMLSGSTDTPVSGDNVDGGSSEDASLSSNDLNELWKSPSAGNNWFVLGHENLFFVPGYNRDGISINGRKYDTGNVRFESKTMKEGYNPTAVIDHMDNIYAGAEATTDDSNAMLYAFDRGDGSILFEFETPSDGKHTRIPEISKTDGGSVIFGSDSSGSGENQEPLLYAVDPQDGTEQWRAAPEPREGFINGLTATGGSVYLMIDTLRVYDAETGNLQQEESGIDGFYGISYTDEKIITAGDPIQAYDTVDQEIVWETSSPGGNVERPLISTKSVLYGTSETGYVFALDSSSGDTLWTSRIDGSATQRSPVVLGSTLWVPGDNGEVTVFIRETGKKAFSIAPPTAGSKRPRPLEVLNEVVYLGGDNPVTYTLDIL